MRLLLGVLLALVSAPEVSAATWTVNNFGDAPIGSPANASGPPGSLRYILKENAGPGDTILFEDPLQVTANFTIRVPQNLTGLIIDGSVDGGRAAIRFVGVDDDGVGLSVLANGVTIKNLVFNDAGIDIGKPNVLALPANIKILDNRFTGARGSVDFGDTRKATIQGNVFDGSASPGLDGTFTFAAKVISNRFAGTGLRAFYAEAARNMLVQDNTFESGRTVLIMDGGHVSGNHFTGASLGVQTTFDPDEPRNVFVDGNEFSNAGAALLTRGALEVTGNTFTNAPLVVLGCNPDAHRNAKLVYDDNTVVRGGGVESRCLSNGLVKVLRSRVEETSGPSLFVKNGRAEIRGTRLTGGAAGVLVARGARAKIYGGLISGNDGAGVRIRPGALPTTVSRVPMGANLGPGIDRGAQGQTPSASPGAPVLRYDRKKVKLRGRACPGCLVEIFESEEGDKIGNPGHGEGIRFLGQVRANGLGRFVFPARGDFECPPSGLVTATATRTISGTSEFARDVSCSCVVSDDFAIDPESIPSTGFGNFGLEVGFEEGTDVGDAILTDTATDEYPTTDALGTALSWSKLIFGLPPLPGDDFIAGFKVNVGWSSSTPPTGDPLVWRYSIDYKPPPAANGQCRAVILFVTEPYP